MVTKIHPKIWFLCFIDSQLCIKVANMEGLEMSNCRIQQSRIYQQLIGNSISYTKELGKDLLPISNHMGPTNIVCLFFFSFSFFIF
jgi:hypothetical protein